MKIWIDLDNTPHVPFFKPILRELRARGYEVLLTARDAFQVCDLATRMGLVYTTIGRHYGKNRFMKIWGLGWRTMQLLPLALREKPAIGLSHGSRAQIVSCNLLRIPSVMIMDYEHAQTPPLVRPRWEIVPKVLTAESLHCRNGERIRAYDGIKEDVYAQEFNPDPSLLRHLHLDCREIIVTVRPPATEAHYHNPESEALFVRFMDRLCGTPGTRAVLLPRNSGQADQIRASWPGWFTDNKVIIPLEAVDGLNLLWHSDLVVSGGGTMNREAAALGVPVYSVFRGKIGAVDRLLAASGKLVMIEKPEDTLTKIPLIRRNKPDQPDRSPRAALKQILAHLEDILKLEGSGSRVREAAAIQTN